MQFVCVVCYVCLQGLGLVFIDECVDGLCCCGYVVIWYCDFVMVGQCGVCVYLDFQLQFVQVGDVQQWVGFFYVLVQFGVQVGYQVVVVGVYCDGVVELFGGGGLLYGSGIGVGKLQYGFGLLYGGFGIGCSGLGFFYLLFGDDVFSQQLFFLVQCLLCQVGLGVGFYEFELQFVVGWVGNV